MRCSPFEIMSVYRERVVMRWFASCHGIEVVKNGIAVSAIAMFIATRVLSTVELNVIAWELALFALQTSNPPLVVVLRSCNDLNNVTGSET